MRYLCGCASTYLVTKKKKEEKEKETLALAGFALNHFQAVGLGSATSGLTRAWDGLRLVV